jgi:hypothetical protein
MYCLALALFACLTVRADGAIPMCTTCPPSHPYPLDWCAGACCVGPTNCSSPCGCRSACMCGSACAAGCPTPPVPVAPTPAPPACAAPTPAPPAPLSGKYSGRCKIATDQGSHANCTVGEYVNASITFNSTRADWFPNCGPKGTFSYQATYSDPCAAFGATFSYGEPCEMPPNEGACTGGCYTGLNAYCGDNTVAQQRGASGSILNVMLNPNSGLLSGSVAYGGTYGGKYTCTFDSLSQNCFCQNSKCVVDPAATLPCAKCNTPGACV